MPCLNKALRPVLPQPLFPNSHEISYLYSANGTKLARMVAGNTTDTTYYMGSFEYKNGELNQVFTSEGRVRYDETSGDYHYDYYLKDHLGNTRVLFTDSAGTAQVLQVSNYYPFGMRFGQSPEVRKQSNDYLYNGKEKQAFGLDWYDYGARMYDAALARWHSIDALAEDYYSHSPYNYTKNNPIRFIDPDGNRVDDFYFNKDSKELIKYVENDQPDRVFVATGETKIDENAEAPMPEPVYEQVEMSEEKVESLMNDNGYKKVIKEMKKVEVDITTVTSKGSSPSLNTSTLTKKILDMKTKYTKKSNTIKNVKSVNLERLDMVPNNRTLVGGALKTVKPYKTETYIRKKSYNYSKPNNKSKGKFLGQDARGWYNLIMNGINVNQ